jgi:transposase InsO family protein
MPNKPQGGILMDFDDEKWSLFWCNLLHPVIFGRVEERQINRHLKKLAQEEILFPDGKKKTPSLSTLRRKLNLYSHGGFRGLARKSRSDRGKIRSVDQEILDKAVELKKEQPFRSDETINRILEAQYQKTIAPSTLYRHLRKAGATRLKLGVTGKKVRKRFTRDHTHDLWVGDFEEGPYVLVNGEVLATYLCLFIDCHSRYVVDGRYYLRQNLDILIDSLLRAWSVHGKSKELYVDNARIYYANALKSACYELNINLLHRPPHDPAAGGLVERVFQTIQVQFESEVRSGELLALNALNRGFSAYLEMAYHTRIHSETGQSPKNRYNQGLTVLRHVNMQQIIQFFMRKVLRTVDKDFSDIQLNNTFYRVDPKLRGDRVQVRFDPFSDMKTVWIYTSDNQYLGQGTMHNRDKSAEPSKLQPKGKPQNNYIDLLVQEHEKQLKVRANGIDYREILSTRQWPFTAFAHTVARLMGQQKKGLSTFNAEELEMLKKAYNRMPALSELTVEQAWLQAPQKTIPHLICQLQNMK